VYEALGFIVGFVAAVVGVVWLLRRRKGAKRL